MEPVHNESEYAEITEIKTEDDQTDPSALLTDDSLAVIGDILPLQNVGQGSLQYIQVVNQNNEIQLIQCLSCDDGSGGSSLVRLVSRSDTCNGHLVIQPISLPAENELGLSDDVESALSPSQETSCQMVESKNSFHLDERLPDDLKSDSPIDEQPLGVLLVKNDPDPSTSSAVERLDLNRPIALTKDTIITVNDEKCVLRLDPDTNTLVAYPLKDNSAKETKSVIKRKRGRPPKTPKASSINLTDQSSNLSFSDPANNVLDDKVEDSEEEKSGAAECLLGLADGRRKSSRIKKLPTQLMDYEIEQKDNLSEAIAGVEDTGPGVAAVPEIQDDRTRLVVPKIETPNQMQIFLANLGLPVKRGRGRPRRKPLQVSADVQRLLPALLPKLSPVSTMPTASPAAEETAIIIRQEDGCERHFLVSAASAASINFASLTSDIRQDLGASFSDACEDVDSAEPVKEVLTTTGNCGEIFVPSTMFQIPSSIIPSQNSLPIRIGPKLKEDELMSLRCSKCDFQALYSHQLQEHIADQHSGDSDELFKCKCCTHLSLDNEGLVAHFQECHPKCICSICGFTAEHSYIVKRHMQRHDSAGCECSICGKKYKDQYILKMHFKMVHMPAEVLFQCQICLKMFTRKAHLKRHLRIHNPNKPFKCPHCEYRGCERSDINKHLLIHNEPKYSCEICLKTFRHIKNKELHVRRHQGQRDYTCGTCGFRGYTYTDIRKHIERKHVEMHNVCNRCGVTFKSDSMLHVKEHLCDMILLEQALEATGNGVEEECYSNDPIQLVTEDQSLLNDPQHVIISGNSVDISLETLALPDESLQLMETSLDQEQIIGDV